MVQQHMVDAAVRGAVEQRWGELRKQHNRKFMSFGPGEEWERWQQQNRSLYLEEAALSLYLGKQPVRSPHTVQEQPAVAAAQA